MEGDHEIIADSEEEEEEEESTKNGILFQWEQKHIRFGSWAQDDIRVIDAEIIASEVHLNAYTSPFNLHGR